MPTEGMGNIYVSKEAWERMASRRQAAATRLSLPAYVTRYGVVGSRQARRRRSGSGENVARRSAQRRTQATAAREAEVTSSASALYVGAVGRTRRRTGV
jgi:hypothetical protein